MATTLTPYAGDMAAQAIADAARMNRRIRSAVLRISFVAVSIVMIGVLFKFFGLTPLLWGLIFVVIVYTGASLFGYVLAATPPLWIVNFFRGILGEENKGPEGVTAGNNAVKKLWRAWIWTMSYATVALEIIALWNIEDNLILVVPLIAVGMIVMLFSFVLFKESNFFPWMVFYINCGILIMMLVMALPGNAGITVTRWVDQARTATKAHKAEDTALRAAEEAQVKKRATCYESIATIAKAGTIPTTEQFKECEKIGIAVASRNEAEKARDEATMLIRNTRINEAAKCFKGLTATATTAEKDRCEALLEAINPVSETAQSSRAVSSTAPAAAATAEATSATPATVCNQVVKVVDYTPSTQLGWVEAGRLPAGRYEVSITGTRQQMFFVGNPQDPVPEQQCQIDGYGRLGFCWSPDGQRVVRNKNGELWFPPANAPGNEPLLITEQPGEPRVPYGALVMKAMGKRLPIASPGRPTYLEFDQEFALSLNTNVFQGLRNHEGSGGLQVEIKQCQKT
ncbi:MAG: hypothetical protein WBO92_03065 [Candidatus Moraniibacteriota bacterium]